jgi:tetratricopeptide (TPR) repeat protein
MASSDDGRRSGPGRWTDELGYWYSRRAERKAESSEEGLALAEERLAKSRAKRGPESWRTVNAMEAVAKWHEVAGHYEEALPLRQQVFGLRRKNLGSGNELTLAAEARLAVTFIELRRPRDAEPLLTHVLKGLSATKGPDDPTVLAVTERLADVQFALGESDDARRLLREEMAHYEERGEEFLVSGVAIKLATVLIKDGEYAEAPELLRSAVDIRSRLLGPDDPETLTARRNLVSSLVWTRDFAEASIVARNLLATSIRANGADHPDTVDARHLVENIDRELRED